MSRIFETIQQRVASSDRLGQALIALWPISSIVMSAGLAAGSVPVQVAGAVLATLYILALAAWLYRGSPTAADLPAPEPIIRFPSSYPAMLWVVVGLVVIVTGLTCFLLGDGWQMLLLSVPLAVVIVVVWRKRLTRRHAIVSVAILIVLAVVESLLGEEQSSGLIIPILVAIMFLAGALLLDHTRLTHIRLLDGDYGGAGVSFAWGCLLAVPPALLNLLSLQLTPPTDFDRLFDRWPEVLYALQPGIVEEVWARLLLTTLVYALLRPLSGERPGRALVWAMVISAFIHGAAHYPGSITSPLEALYIALMYGIPLVLLFVKRDLERAVAYHFFIDLVRFAAFVIWNASVT